MHLLVLAYGGHASLDNLQVWLKGFKAANVREVRLLDVSFSKTEYDNIVGQMFGNANHLTTLNTKNRMFFLHRILRFITRLLGFDTPPIPDIPSVVNPDPNFEPFAEHIDFRSRVYMLPLAIMKDQLTGEGKEMV